MSSIPEEDVQHTSSVARQVFPEAIPSVTASESEAKDAEDIPAASADEEREEERDGIPPANDHVVQEEDVIVPDPPVHEAMEVEANEAATTVTTEANDVVMAEDHVAPEDNVVPEAHEQPEANVDADATVPPPRPHTIEQAYNRGELVQFGGPSWCLPLLPDLSMITMWSRGHKFRSRNQGCQGFLVLLHRQDHSV